ncbi:hypothetical protein MKZ38_005286 [Zalerion maritima]|uniref:Intradiol ring-cleavage dioxygenases domain-containing protein n=1 Tax=Zalerion maritima TaxID=339359 RepID=A0AAD5RKD5_9PEZI|nr:hypothetical protein MKZ38_005286 [Zalerion maritima]
MRFTNVGIAALAANLASAHPGHNIKQEAVVRRDAMKAMKGPRSLGHCAEKIKSRGLERKNVLRRNNLMNTLVQKRGLKARDLDSVLATSHLSSEDYDLDTDEATLFASNGSCVLTPEVTQGPYYVDGEYVREDMSEDQPGVPLYIDAQVLDVDTCDPVESVYVEAWHCNATGVYSGIVASGNGDSSDESNMDNTFLRGVQATDSEGVVGFQSIFPGHYTSRATHIHVFVHANASELANGTIMDTTASHVGQMFFDQDLISGVEDTSPYSTNTQELTTNEEDLILSEEADGVDPVMEYVLLGDTVEDGILAWLSFGIDASSSYSVNSAATYYEDGGIASEDTGFGGGEAPSGSMPSGTLPSGVAPGASASGVAKKKC